MYVWCRICTSLTSFTVVVVHRSYPLASIVSFWVLSIRSLWRSLGEVTNHPHLRAPCFVCPFMMAQSVTHVPAWRRPNERALSGFSTRLWDNSAPQNCSSQSQSFQYIGTLSQWLYEPIYTGLRQKPPEINSNLRVTENVLLFKTGFEVSVSSVSCIECSIDLRRSHLQRLLTNRRTLMTNATAYILCIGMHSFTRQKNGCDVTCWKCLIVVNNIVIYVRTVFVYVMCAITVLKRCRCATQLYSDSC